MPRLEEWRGQKSSSSNGEFCNPNCFGKSETSEVQSRCARTQKMCTPATPSFGALRINSRGFLAKLVGTVVIPTLRANHKLGGTAPSTKHKSGWLGGPSCAWGVREVPKIRYSYDPHLRPVLRFDGRGEDDQL